MAEDYEVVPNAPSVTRKNLTKQVDLYYNAALRVAEDGHAIRVRAEDPRGLDSLAAALARRARYAGLKCHVQRGTNNTMLVWIDKP